MKMAPKKRRSQNAEWIIYMHEQEYGSGLMASIGYMDYHIREMATPNPSIAATSMIS